jgi:uroporphyrinogen-III synthase
VFLLKTRSQPDDGYEDYFAKLTLGDSDDHPDLGSTFEAHFVPVLEHQQNADSLRSLESLLRKRQLTEKYGGLIFTSQRAVEGFSDVVRKLDSESRASDQAIHTEASEQTTHTPISPSLTTPFPLYVVGPATAHSLSTLFPSPTLGPLHTRILGEHTGNGAALAQFMLQHYNGVHANLLFEYYEAPRLPFIPLVGPASGQYARQRLEQSDERLRKKPLLFLVGEVRRDVIPKTLMNTEIGDKAIQVDEWEVYSTVVRDVFEEEFRILIGGIEHGRQVAVFKAAVASSIAVIVVFSPQGCEAMLRVLGFLDEDGRAKEHLRRDRWQDSRAAGAQTKFVVATIGPTTRDYLIDKFDFEPDICASKPSPAGVAEGVKAFLKSNRFR